VQSKLNTFLNNDYSNDKESINKCVSEFQNIILEASKKSLKRKKENIDIKSIMLQTKKWFDEECRIKRHQLRKVANQKHRDPNNNEIRISYHTALRDEKEQIPSGKNSRARKRYRNSFNKLRYNNSSKQNQSYSDLQIGKLLRSQ
jgi:predicted nuclease with TOPRIM domain